MADVGEIKYVASIDTSAYKKGAGDIENANKDIEKSTDDAGKSTGKFSKTGAAAFGLVSGAAFALANKAIAAISSSIDGAIKRVDTLNNAPNVLQNLGFSAAESAKAIEQIDKGVRGLPTSLDEIASSLVSIASSSGLSIDRATELTVAFNNMALAGGKGPQEAQRALVQFTQALGKGKIPAQEFNTLMEVMPAQITQVAKTLLGAEANAYTLRDAMSDGTVTIDQFNDTVIDLNKKGGKNFASFADQAKTATGGIATGWRLVQTAVTRGVASIITAIGGNEITNTFLSLRQIVDATFKGLAAGIKFASDAIKLLIEWLRPLIDYVTQNKTVMEVLKVALIAIGAVLLGTIIVAITAVVVAVTLLTAVIDILVKAFTWVMEVGIAAWNGIASAWNKAANFFTGVVNNIKSAFSVLVGFFQALWGNIVNIFTSIGTSIGNAIGGAFKSVMNGVISFVENTVNGVAKAINKVAKGIDDVLPGDQSNFRVPEVKLPRFAAGGFTGRGGKYDEAGIVHRGEYVLPQNLVNQATGLPNMAALANEFGGSGNATSNTYQITIPISGAIVTSPQDQRKFAEVIGKKINEVMQQKGYKPALEGM